MKRDPEIRNSRNNPLNEEMRENSELHGIGSLDRGSVKNLTQPIPQDMKIKDKQQSEAVTGKKSQRVNNNSILPAVV